MSKVILSFDIDENVKATLIKMAEEQDRKLSPFIRIILTKMAKEWIAKNES